MGLLKKKITVTKSLAMNGKDTGAIVGVKGYLLGQIIRLEAGKEIVIGRDSKNVDVVLDGDRIKGKHCSIKYIQGDKAYQVINLSGGELIADMEEELIEGEIYILQPGTRIYIGSNDNEVRLG